MNVVTMPTKSAVLLPSGVPSSSSSPVPASSLSLIHLAKDERQPDDDGRGVVVSSSGTGKMMKEEGDGTNDEHTNPNDVRSVRVVKKEPQDEEEKNTQGPTAAAAIHSHTPPQDSINSVPVRLSSSGVDTDAVSDSDSDSNHDSDRNPSTRWDTGNWCWLFSPVGTTVEERTPTTTQSTTTTTTRESRTRGPDLSNSARHKDEDDDAYDQVTTRHTEALSIPAPVVSSSLPVVPSAVVSSSSIIPTLIAKKEEEEVERPDEDNDVAATAPAPAPAGVVSTRKPTICGNNNKRKTKEENCDQKDDDENKDENENDNDDGCVAVGEVNKGRQEKENAKAAEMHTMRNDDGNGGGNDDNDNCDDHDDNNSNNDNFYSDWVTGNWCWPVLPVTKTATATRKNQSKTNHTINSTLAVLPKDNDAIDSYCSGSHIDKHQDRIYSVASWKSGNWCWLAPMVNTTATRSTKQNDNSAVQLRESHAASANGVVEIKRKRTKHTNSLQFRPTKKMKRGSSRNDINLSKTEYEFPDKESDDTIATRDSSTVVSNSTAMDGRNDENSEDIYDDNDDDDDESSSTERQYTAFQDKDWNSMLRRLFAYKYKFDSVDVPSICVDDRELGNWVRSQRYLYQTSSISSDRIKRLESIGFSWSIFDTKWMRMYHKLIEYKKKFNSVNVHHYYDDDRELGEWVSTQRRLYKNNTISSDRSKKLDSIGFSWNPRDQKWMLMYNRLLAYRRRNKSTFVPAKYDTDPELRYWVSKQRSRYHKKLLATDRINRLESIEFVW